MEGTEFFFQGLPAGRFLDPAPPERDGTFPYVPLKGPGHAGLSAALRAPGPARCWYDSRRGRHLFDVLAIPEPGRLETADHRLSALPAANLVAWLEPWVPATAGPDLEKELEKEVPVGHALHGKACKAVARRVDKDEVLFQVDGEAGAFAVVHLTWAGQAEAPPASPRTEIFASLGEWVERKMKPDHQAFMGP